MQITHENMHEKGSFIISLENTLSHIKIVNAHTVSHIQEKYSSLKA